MVSRGRPRHGRRDRHISSGGRAAAVGRLYRCFEICIRCAGYASTPRPSASALADDLDRPRPRRPAARFRRPAPGGARGRRRANPKSRHHRRQPLQRLARRRRRAALADARCRGSSWPGPRGARRLPCRRSSPEPAHRSRRRRVPDRPHHIARRRRARAAFLKPGARRYLVISIAMAAAPLDIATGRPGRTHRGRGPCSAVAQRLAGPEGQPRWRADCSLDSPNWSTAALELAPLSPIDDVRG